MSVSIAPSIVLGSARRRVAALAAAGLAAGAVAVPALAPTADAADATSPEVVYSTAPDAAPPSYPSIGYNARSTLAVGDIVELGGTKRALDSIDVSLNSWACETGTWNTTCDTTPGTSYTHPVTATVYAVEGSGAAATPGATLAEVTTDITVPFRPSADEVNCGLGTTQWYDAAADSCQNGYSFIASFDFSSLDVALPDQIAVAFSTLTSKNSELPGGGYDALNIDLGPLTASVGTDVDTDSILIDAYAPVGYLDGGSGGLDSLRQDLGWSGYVPAFTITATDVPAQTAVLYDFETESSVTADSGAQDGFINASRVESVADGMPAAAGCYIGVLDQNLDNGAYVYQMTRFGGYTDKFPTGGWTTSVDFYLDTEVETGGTLNQFDWSVASNGTDGNHRRDFIFHAQSAGAGSWTLGASNNTGFEGVDVAPLSGDTVTINEAGWYTVTHAFTSVDGVLSVDISVAKAGEAALKTWTRSNDADLINQVVGGNRYGWMTVNGFDNLPIDNVLLNAERPTAGCGEDTPEGGSTDGGTETPVKDCTAVADRDFGSMSARFEGTYCGESFIASGSYMAQVTDVAPAPADTAFPHGAFAVTLNVEEGSSVDVTLELASPVTSLLKDVGEGWEAYPATISGTTVEFTLTDGGAGDADGVANGVIVDPVAPAISATFTG